MNTPVWNSTVTGGTKAPKIWFPGPVGQKIIDGGLADIIAINTGPNAEIHGGEWRNFGTPGLASVPPIVHGIQLGDAAVLEDAWVHNCKVSGIWVNGVNVRVSLSRSSTNGRGGLEGGEDGAILEYCDIDGNNTAGNHPGGEGGAFKFLFCQGGHFHHNYVHGNLGFGAWWDTGNSDCLIEENVCEDNQRSGLFYEASAGSVIRNNYIANNGADLVIGGNFPSPENCVQLRISDANCTGARGQVQFNLIDYTLSQTGTLGGLIVLWDHTGSVSRSVQNWDIHDNQFWLRGTTDRRVGGSDTAPAAFPVWSSGNSFFDNEYRVASMSTSYWKWDTGTGAGVAKTYAEWQA